MESSRRVWAKVVGAWSIGALALAAMTAWRAAGGAGCGECGSHEWKPRERLSASFNASMARLHDLSTRRRLSDEDAAIVLRMLDRHAPDLPARHTPGEVSAAAEEAGHAVGYAYAIMSRRLREGGITDTTRAAFAARAVAGLDSANPRERLIAVSAACSGGLITDEAVRNRVEALQSDENESVRTQASRQLAHYDKIAAREHEASRGRGAPPSGGR